MDRRTLYGLTLLSIGLLLVVPLGVWMEQSVFSQPRWLGEVEDGLRTGQYLQAPGALSYDPKDGNLWVAPSVIIPVGPAKWGNVTAVNPVTGGLVATVVAMTQDNRSIDPPVQWSVTTNADGSVVFDLAAYLCSEPTPGSVCSNLTWIDPMRHSVTLSHVVEYEANAVAYDSGNGDLYLTGSLTANSSVTVINGTSGALIRQLPGGGAGVVASPYTHRTFVGESNGTVMMINDQTNQLMGWKPMEAHPSAYSTCTMVLDGPRDRVYVAGVGSGSGAGPPVLVALNASTGKEMEAVALAPSGVDWSTDASSLLLDPENGYLYVTYESLPSSGGTAGGDGIEVVDPVDGAIMGSFQFGARPSPLAYDSSNGKIYVSDWSEGTIWVVNPNAPAPSWVTVVTGLPNADWAFVGMACGTLLIVAGGLKLRKTRWKTEAGTAGNR